MLNQQLIFKFGCIRPKTTGQSNRDTFPYEESEYSLNLRRLGNLFSGRYYTKRLFLPQTGDASDGTSQMMSSTC